MISQSAIDYLRLNLVSGVGAYTGQQLIEAFGSVEAIWQQSEKAWLMVEGVGPKLVSALSAASSLQTTDDIENILQTCAQENIHIICQDDDAWPKGLYSCDDAPMVLYVRGELTSLQSNKILAMVGARKASAEGKLIARRWAAYCAKQAVSVISGMAPGIDSAAHGGSLDADYAGIAVLGYGLLAGSAQQIRQMDALAEKGCVLSEYAPHTVAKAGYFPQRNRLIAGIAQALIVIEGGLKSGSLITARQASEYGRDVFAVPGSVLNDIHAGCHQLIQDGAILAADAADVLQHLAWHAGETKGASYQPTSDIEEKIMGLLGRQIMHVDSLAEDCGLTVHALSSILLRLELQGVIEKLPGSRYTLS
ncbi:MAG: DNA-processing protein DprA [Ghiorsea sp.]|nr:DNA-processing protein DprA [Ghiorsea sp.]